MITNEVTSPNWKKENPKFCTQLQLLDSQSLAMTIAISEMILVEEKGLVPRFQIT
jgi:hypothetical protein